MERRTEEALSEMDFRGTRPLLITWLVTAAWDFLCASALGVLGYHSTLMRFWQGVASVLLGPGAFKMGTGSAAVGLALHLTVAFIWSAAFILALRKFATLRQVVARPGGAFAVACAYGPLIWLVMSLIVIPIATRRLPSLGSRWWVQVFAHIPFVTIPLVFTARRMILGSMKFASRE